MTTTTWRQRKTGAPDTCTVNTCTNPHKGRGYCSAHYKRWARYGDPLGQPTETKPGRPTNLTPNMIEDLEWMARHDESATNATTRINAHTEATTTLTVDQLIRTLRDYGHRGMAARLLINDPIPDDELLDGFDTAGPKSRRISLEKSAAKWRPSGDA